MEGYQTGFQICSFRFDKKCLCWMCYLDLAMFQYELKSWILKSGSNRF